MVNGYLMARKIRHICLAKVRSFSFLFNPNISFFMSGRRNYTVIDWQVN